MLHTANQSIIIPIDYPDSLPAGISNPAPNSNSVSTPCQRLQHYHCRRLASTATLPPPPTPALSSPGTETRAILVPGCGELDVELAARTHTHIHRFRFSLTKSRPRLHTVNLYVSCVAAVPAWPISTIFVCSESRLQSVSVRLFTVPSAAAIHVPVAGEAKGSCSWEQCARLSTT